MSIQRLQNYTKGKIIPLWCADWSCMAFKSNSLIDLSMVPCGWTQWECLPPWSGRMVEAYINTTVYATLLRLSACNKEHQIKKKGVTYDFICICSTPEESSTGQSLILVSCSGGLLLWKATLWVQPTAILVESQAIPLTTAIPKKTTLPQPFQRVWGSITRSSFCANGDATITCKPMSPLSKSWNFVALAMGQWWSLNALPSKRLLTKGFNQQTYQDLP